MEIVETPASTKVQNLCITGWTVIEEEYLTKIDLAFEENLQQVDSSVDLELVINYQLIDLLKEFKDIFAWTYNDLKGIPPKIAQHQIELDTSIPHVHQARYQLNPNYAAIVKHDIDKFT